ncbi:branched-chain amino acid ABC transporter permease [Nordella sp. HKS 07]|uniref:branched-chain amino acid ABC transporter permease n=1 Tax=Nordella sp. HKS 07 TaxID=2712222 RepID=UPI0013E1795E|nr:branched-chain amino acid ABC transporter permease [Nordella sp. HKS 07]QIG49100.1 branched-chain amino acid ABC transporter permease [Nordella sp. HKS 07]
MQAVLQILITGLTLGAMYALASVGLALTYGTMRMFNMAHGIFMAIGAYATYSAASVWGWPLPLAFLAGLAAGGLIGAIVHLLVVRFMLETEGFEVNIIVATAGVSILLQDLLLKYYGAYPFRQPAQIEGVFRIGEVAVTYQSVAILVTAAALISGIAWLLTHTRFGLAIRATAMNREAALLMGVEAGRTYLQVLIIAGVLAAAAGVLISSLATLSPDMGANPLLRAFVICVVAGLGSVTGAGIAALALGLFEAAIQYYLGVRYGFPVMLLLVIIVLIWKPAGLFGQQEVVRS